MANKDIDELSGVETTGHEWDGIKELNTPLPRWWLWTFYATIVFAIVWSVLYPSWPIVDGATKGWLGDTSRAELDRSLDEVRLAHADLVAQIAESDVTAIIANPELERFARTAGASLFKVNCVQCHGSGAAGSEGYPNLNDDEWIWGGTPAAIYTTIRHGARFEGDEATHVSQMPGFGKDGILDREQIREVAGYVASLSGLQSDLKVTEAGKTLFADNCASCHGAVGQGNPEFGAPPLDNAIWLYKGTPEAIIAQVTAPRQGQMPAWGSKLGDVAVKQLAVYVHALGGGQ